MTEVRNKTASPFDILHEGSGDSQPQPLGKQQQQKTRASVNSLRGKGGLGSKTSMRSSMPQIVQDATILPEQARQMVLEASLNENEHMRKRMTQQENDLMDLVSVFKQENEERDSTIRNLQNELTQSRENWEKERARIVGQHQAQVSDLQTNISEKESNMSLIQQELHVIKDFRKKRQQLFKELEMQRQQVQEMDRRYKETLMKMEKKFLEEKIRLQREANRKISELASKAHKEAISNLTETQRTVFKENVRMAEALRFHIQEREDLTKQNSHLQEVHKSMGEEKKLHDEIVKQKILQTKSQTLRIQELEKKIIELEHSLSFVIREFEHERQLIGEMARKELDEVRTLADVLRKRLKKKTEEMTFIRSLARYIYDQRSDLERFFLDALDQVRQMKGKEMEERRKARLEFHREMVRQGKAIDNPQLNRPAARNGNLSPVPMTTSKLQDELALLESSNSSTSSFHRKPENLDISELSLEEKERVLRLLFAKMNNGMTDPSYTSQSAGVPHNKQQLRFDMVQTPVTPSGYSLDSFNRSGAGTASVSVSPDIRSMAATSPKSNKVSEAGGSNRSSAKSFKTGQDEQKDLQTDLNEPQLTHTFSRRSLVRLNDNEEELQGEIVDNGDEKGEESGCQNGGDSPPKSPVKKTESSSSSPSPDQTPRRSRVKFHNQVQKVEYEKDEAAQKSHFGVGAAAASDGIDDMRVKEEDPDVDE